MRIPSDPVTVIVVGAAIVPLRKREGAALRGVSQETCCVRCGWVSSVESSLSDHASAVLLGGWGGICAVKGRAFFGKRGPFVAFGERRPQCETGYSRAFPDITNYIHHKETWNMKRIISLLLVLAMGLSLFKQFPPFLLCAIQWDSLHLDVNLDPR